jgi:hypothetical protein
LINQKKVLEPEILDSYQNFLNYLDIFFLNPNAIFDPSLFNFYDAIVMRGYCTISTYCLETINKQLKTSAGAGLPT